MAHPPAVSRSSPQTAGMHLDAELDDDSLTLTPEQASQADRFRDELRACGTDTARYELCVQKRDELLDRQTGLQLLVATCEQIMSAECPTYQQQKQTRGRKSSEEDDTAQWHRFLGLAREGDDMKSSCLSALKKVARCWGPHIIQHYQWASRGGKYCNQLRAAAKKVSVWDDAVSGLNWSILQRSRNVQQRPVKASANPIEQHDLERLKTWSQDPSRHKKLPIDDIPPGLGFDRFGLLVHQAFAAVLPQADRAGSPGSAAPRQDHSGAPARIDVQGDFALEDSSQTALDPAVSRTDALLADTGRAASEESNHTALDPIVSEVIDSFLAECAGGTCRDQSVADSSPPPHSPGSANSTPNPSAFSENLDQMVLDTDSATESEQDGPVYSAPGASSRMALRQHQPPSYKGMASRRVVRPRAAKHGEAQLSSDQVPKMPSGCCLGVPPSLRSTLANPPVFSRETADRFLPFLGELCIEHLQSYAQQAQAVALGEGARLAEHSHASNRRRRASLPDITPSKRLRLDASPAFSRSPGVSDGRPAHDHITDDAYRRRVLAELEQATPSPGSHGEATNRLVRELLSKVEHPNTDSSRGAVEALFSTGDQAACLAETRCLGDTLIVTEGQQPFRWRGEGREIEQFFSWFPNIDDLSVSAQIPSLPANRRSFKVLNFGDVKRRFLDRKETTDPCNILDLQCPVESTLPTFLSGENCGLLLQVRNRVLMGSSAERVTASLQTWAEWKDVIKWALLSEGGHHTAPHMDSHGYATWITAQEGCIGVAWMSFPTEEERNAWMAEPHRHTGGRWRYIILKPGQTVFFPPGTIHFVFRVRHHQTLALGGHILQWSSIQRSIQVMLWELKNPSTTNEEMKMTAPKLVRTVAKLVRARVSEAGAEALGGEDAVKRFSASVEEFERLRPRSRLPR